MAAINTCLQLTLRSKATEASQATGDWTKLKQLAKKLGFPPEFTKKAVEDGLPYARSKDFLTLLRVRIHNVLNSVMYLQFAGDSKDASKRRDSSSPIKVVNGRYSPERGQRPEIYNQAFRLQQNPFDNAKPSQHQSSTLTNKYKTKEPIPLTVCATYKYYTDNTGNNHPLVRQILKKRPWYTRVDSVKSPASFEMINFFWT